MFGNLNQLFEFFGKDNDSLTCKAGAAITGKRFVKLAAGGTDQVPVVVPCGAGERAYGVAAWDVPIGGKVTVVRRSIATVTAGEALLSGDPVASGPDGKAVKAGTNTPLGDVHADTVIDSDAAVAFTF